MRKFRKVTMFLSEQKPHFRSESLCLDRRAKHAARPFTRAESRESASLLFQLFFIRFFQALLDLLEKPYPLAPVDDPVIIG